MNILYVYIFWGAPPAEDASTQVNSKRQTEPESQLERLSLGEAVCERLARPPAQGNPVVSAGNSNPEHRTRGDVVFVLHNSNNRIASTHGQNEYFSLQDRLNLKIRDVKAVSSNVSLLRLSP